MKAHLCLLAALAAPGVSARVDESLPIVEFRIVPSIDQVRLTAGFIHDPALQATVIARRAEFERRGIILVHVDSARRIVREERVAGHAIRTQLSIYPPTNRGYKGGRSTADVLVTVDGRKKIDCPWDAPDVELSDLSIMPVDGFVSMSGTVDDKSFHAVVALNSDEILDRAWLTAQRTR